MELLTTKIIALTLLGTLSLFFGLLPLRVRKYLLLGSKKRERITSCLLCFGGGVLLATVFIHMIPETREGFNMAFTQEYLTAGEGYPLAELVTCAGFFLIYMVEEFVHKVTKDTGADEQKSSAHSHPHHHHHHHHHHHRHGHHNNAHKLETLESEKQRRESGRCSVYSITEAVKKASVGSPPETFSPKNKWAESGVDNPVFAGDADATTWNPALKDAIVTTSQVGPTSNQDTTGSSDSATAVGKSVSNTNNGGVGHVHSHSMGHSHSQSATHNNSNNDGGHGHSHGELTKLFSKGFAANFRAVIIVLALSIHAVFEGLAVGLQERVSDVWYLFGAIAAHKFVIAFCLGIKLLTTMSMGLMVIYMVVFALVSPLGIAIGILVTESASGDPGNHLVLVTVLQGLAGGTILYVTFFEILEKERARDGGGLLKLLFVFIGFAAMASVEAIGGHSHGPSGDGHAGHSGHSHGGHSHGGHAGHNHDAIMATTPLSNLMGGSHSDHNHDVSEPLADILGDHDHAGHDNHSDHVGHDDHAFESSFKNIDLMDAGPHDGHDHSPDVSAAPSGADLIGDHDHEAHDEHLDHNHDHNHDHGHPHPHNH